MVILTRALPCASDRSSSQSFITNFRGPVPAPVTTLAVADHERG